MPYLKATSFETGLTAKYNNLIEGTENYTSWSGSLSYFSLAFPLSNPINDLLDRVERKYELGMSLSLQPFSSVGYDVFSTEETNGVPGVQRNYIGTGGTYAAQWGTGIKFKDFSAGINLGYLFGNVATYRTVLFTEFTSSYGNYERISSQMNGFIWNLGVQYDLVLNQAELDGNSSTKIKKKVLTIGAYGNPGTSFTSTSSEEFLLVKPISSTTAVVDTIKSSSDIEGSGKLPAKFGVGFMYNVGEKWGAGINFESQLWASYENDSNPVELNNSYRLSGGGFYRPNPQSLTNYFNRIYYQLGLFYATDPITVGEDRINQYGATFGLGLPFINQRKVSNANIGATLGARGINTAIEERYLQLNFGFTFNSNEWFLKRKYK